MGSVNPTVLPLPPLRRLPVSAGVDTILDAYKHDGGVIIQGFLTAPQVERMNQEVVLSLATKGPLQKSESPSAEFIGIRTKRLPAVQHSRTFREEVLENDLIHTLCEKVLVQEPDDGYRLNCAHIIEIGPGSQIQPLHRDQMSWPFWKFVPASGPDACVNFLCALTPFRETNGATRVIPGSHLDPDFAFDDTSKTLPAELDPGDAMFFGGRLVHGAGANITDHDYRRGLTIHFCRNCLNTLEAHPLTIPRELVQTMPYRSQAMLGFRSTWPVQNGDFSYYWGNNFLEIGQYIGLKANDSVGTICRANS